MTAKMNNLRLASVLLVASSILSLCCSDAQSAETDCGINGVQVLYDNPTDAPIACEGVKRAIEFFADHGFKTDQPIRLRMMDEVLIDMVDADGNTGHQERVYGAYLQELGEIHMSSWGTDYILSRSTFGDLAPDPELHTSVIAHEVGHRLFDLLYQRLRKSIERPTTEFLSYVLQIATLREPQKSQVLSLWPDAELPSPYAINTMIYAADPHKFGVMAYRYAESHSDVIKQVFTGDFTSGDIFFGGGN